ncbi:MAG: STAS/SEC14 domain-containing protein [Planctomycetes bacterium]|nr:STAS/SEC14 domain-containing protein [Planctomycetota bacterium]MBL7037331.1 STAS/SEC14 domain-containing protein [Pirellulaceae bacterium]
MPTINIQADVSVDVMVKAAEQLSEEDLGQLTAAVLALRARRSAPSVSMEEAELLRRINARFPNDVQSQYDALIQKRDAETLSEQEYDDLRRLTKETEAFDTSRVEALTQLASVRGVAVSELTRQLQIGEPTDAP